MSSQKILDEATTKMKELLDSYMRSGFTREESLEMVKIHLVDYLMEAE